MTSERSQFHFSYIRDFDRFKATFDEKGWSKKTKKCEEKVEPGFPSYYVVHRFEYKGEDGHTKGRLLVTDLPPAEHEKREERRKKKFQRWKKKQQLIKHQDNNGNGEKESNYREEARHEEVNSRKESVAVASMNKQDDAHTSEIELEKKARKYVEEIINSSIILLQCNVKGNRNPKLAEPAAESREHVLATEQQEEKTKIASLQDTHESKQGKVEHVKCEENPELRDMVRNYVNEIIDNCLVLLQFNKRKTEHPMSTANLSDEITPEQNCKEKEKSDNISSPQECTKLEADRDKGKSNTTELGVRDFARGYVNDIIDKSLALIRCNEREECEYTRVMIPGKTTVQNVNEKKIRDILNTEESRERELAEPAAESREHVLATEQQEERTKIINLQDTLESKQGEVEHVKCDENPDLRDMVRNYVNEIIDNCLVLLQFNKRKTEHPMSTANLSDALTPEQNSKDKEESDNIPSRRECTTIEADRDKGKSNITELGVKYFARGYVNDIIDKSLALIICNEREEYDYARVMVPGKTPEQNVNEKKIREILSTEKRRERESENDGCRNKQSERDLRDTARRLVDEIINTSLALLECEYQRVHNPCEDQEMQKTREDKVVQQPKSLVLLSLSQVRENKEKARTGDIQPPQKCTEQDAKNSRWDRNIPETDNSDVAIRLLEEIIRNSSVSQKYEEQGQELEEMVKIGGSEDFWRSTEQEVKQSQPGTEIKYTPQDCEDSEDTSLLLLLVHNTPAIPARSSPELLDMDDYRKERRQQFDEMMTRDVSTIPSFGVDIASTVDATLSFDTISSNLDVNDTKMELNFSQNTLTMEKKESKMRRMLRRVRKGIRCLCCCFKQ